MVMKILRNCTCSTGSDIFDRFESFDSQVKMKYIIRTQNQLSQEFRRSFSHSWDSESS